MTSDLCARLAGHHAGGRFEDRSWSECRDLCCRDPQCKSFNHRVMDGYNCALSHEAKEDVPNSYKQLRSCQPGGWTYNDVVDASRQRKKRSHSTEHVTFNHQPTQTTRKKLIFDRSNSWSSKIVIKRNTVKNEEELTTGEDDPKKVRAVECKLDKARGSADWTYIPSSCYGEPLKYLTIQPIQCLCCIRIF